MYWYIPLYPNACFYKVFKDFDTLILVHHILLMELERLNQFHNNHGKKTEDIWLNDTPEAVKTSKIMSFKNATYFHYTLARFFKEYFRTKADFMSMNNEEIFLISRVFSFNIEKHHKMKPVYKRFCSFLRSLVSDIMTIDAGIHPIIAAQFNLPPFNYPTMITKGIQEMNYRATSSLDLDIIFRTSKDAEKNFLPASVFHWCNKNQLEYILKLTYK